MFLKNSRPRRDFTHMTSATPVYKGSGDTENFPVELKSKAGTESREFLYRGFSGPSPSHLSILLLIMPY